MKRLVFPYSLINEHMELMSQSLIKERFPLGWSYLFKCKNNLIAREHGRFSDNWWAFSRPQNMTDFASPKIMTPEIAFGCQMTLDKEGVYYHTTKVYSFIFKPDHQIRVRFFLGLLNSKVLWFFINQTGYVLRGGYYTFASGYLKPFPLPESTNEQQDAIAQIVDQILTLKESDSSADTTILEGRINRLVYDLYGFTDEEIAVIEGLV